MVSYHEIWIDLSCGRSPGFYYDSGSYCVDSVGDVSIWVVTNSYGRSSPSSYRSLSEDGTYWEEITDIAFYLYNGGDCSDGFYVGGRVRNSYGISLYQEKNIYRSPIISFNNSYAYLVELDGLVFNYNWDFGNSCGHFFNLKL